MILVSFFVKPNVKLQHACAVYFIALGTGNRLTSYMYCKITVVSAVYLYST